MKAEQFNFDDMRPYHDAEVSAALARIATDPLFTKLGKYIWPEVAEEILVAKAKKIHSVLDFQLQFMHPAIRSIVDRSTDGLSYSGLENLNKEASYLFIANHRDILLDSALLQIILVENNFKTSEITFGNNLMETEFITDFGKLNRMFTVLREGTGRELYDISKKLSAYIRHTIIDKRVSVWIAQRSGRTKDGYDQTQTGLLKMLNMSGVGELFENFSELKIVPLTLSYEYEPCDKLKVQELYLSSLHTQYKKSQGEDLTNIITGIVEPKGRIHLVFGKPINPALGQLTPLKNENEKIKKLAALIDQQIYENYKLWPVNYIAGDLLEKNSRFATHYSAAEKEKFQKHFSAKLENLDGDKEGLLNLYLKIYANPVYNKIANSKS